MITGIAIGLVCLITLMILLKNRNYYFLDSDASVGRIRKPIIGFVVGMAIAIFQPFALERVMNTGVGFKINLSGDERGLGSYQYTTGWVVVNEWVEQLMQVETNLRHLELDTMVVLCKGGFPAKIKPTFNYRVLAEKAGDMYINLKVPLDSIEKGWLKSAIIGAMTDVANRWTIDSLFNSRERYEMEVVNEVNARVSQWFYVDNKSLRTNITPPESLQESIIAKNKAVQGVQVAMSNAEKAKAEGIEQVAREEAMATAKIIRARGDSTSTMITAHAEAEAIRAQQMTLTPLYIEYLKASRWNGALPTVTGGSTPMIQLK